MSSKNPPKSTAGNATSKTQPTDTNQSPADTLASTTDVVDSATQATDSPHATSAALEKPQAESNAAPEKAGAESATATQSSAQTANSVNANNAANENSTHNSSELSPAMIELVEELRDMVKQQMNPRRHTRKSLRRATGSLRQILDELDALQV